MASVKRVDGDYTIQTIGSGTVLKLTATTITVDGNLLVQGSTTTVETTNTAITDNIITLNNGQTGTPATSLRSGIEINRGSSPVVSLRWNELLAKWQITTDGSTYGQIMTKVEDDTAPRLGGNLDTNGYSLYLKALNSVSISGAAWATNVATLTFTTAASVAPFASGDLITVAGITAQKGYNGTYTVLSCNTTTLTYTNTASGLTTLTGLTGVTATFTPSDNLSYNILYPIAGVGTGGTGIKFVTKNGATYVRDELVSRKKCIVYSLIF
jgi:filamentous hemagglutinin family protein